MNAFSVVFVALILCVCGSVATPVFGQCEKGHPVLMIPGIFGTILHIDADIPPSVSLPWYCTRKYSNRRLWIDATMELRYPCFSAYLGQNFSATDMKWVKTEGVNLSVPEWGKVYAVDTLDPSAVMKNVIPYYHDMIQALENVGYIDGVNMAGGGYQWYDVPTEEWAHKIMDLIEDMYSKNNNNPVVVVSHSMGAPFSYFMLQTAGDAWVKQHIHKLIYVAPAWMGSPKALNFMFDGIDYKIPIAGKALAPLSRHVPTVWMLLPWADAYKGKIMATSPSKNYTYDMIEDLLNDIGAQDVEAKLKTTMGVFNKYNNYENPPPVPVITYMGRNVDTLSTLVFKKDIVKSDPEGTWTDDSVLYGDGDGTVPAESLRYPTDKWASKGADVETHYIDKAEHVKILYNQDLINAVIAEAC